MQLERCSVTFMSSRIITPRSPPQSSLIDHNNCYAICVYSKFTINEDVCTMMYMYSSLHSKPELNLIVYMQEVVFVVCWHSLCSSVPLLQPSLYCHQV